MTSSHGLGQWKNGIGLKRNMWVLLFQEKGDFSLSGKQTDNCILRLRQRFKTGVGRRHTSAFGSIAFTHPEDKTFTYAKHWEIIILGIIKEIDNNNLN